MCYVKFFTDPIFTYSQLIHFLLLLFRSLLVFKKSNSLKNNKFLFFYLLLLLFYEFSQQNKYINNYSQKNTYLFKFFY
jgi:hypothetical protein